MKKNYKKTQYIAMALVVFAFAGPLSVVAQTASSTPNNGRDFCDRLDGISSNLEKRITNREEQFRKLKDQRLEKFLKSASSTSERLGTTRDKWDENRDEQYAKLLERADTDAKKKAVEQFRSAMNTAIAKRRAAIDTAVKIFRDDVASMIGSRKSALEKAVAHFRTSERNALKVAKDTCAQNGDVKTIRQNFNRELHTIQRTFERERTDANRLGVGVDGFARKRQEAFRKAREEFENTTQKARQDLKTAFSE